MTYVGEFVDTGNNPYTIEIDTQDDTGRQEVTLGGNPILVNMSAEDKHLYSPIKTTGATITLVTDGFLFGIYTGQALGTKVTLSDGDGKARWIGYLTPCMYDQGFDTDREEIELECVDGIAALKDIQYTRDGGEIVTFLAAIRKCLQKAGVYDRFYISDNVQVAMDGDDSVIERFRVSEANFFDEKDDAAQTDDDVAWSCYDVLYQICQYLGYTLVADGDSVYIIDYDAVRNGLDTYREYDVWDDSVPASRVTLSYSYHIDGDSHAENGAKVSLDDVYNKVTVCDEFHTYESLFPELGDDSMEVNITSADDVDMESWVRLHINGNTFVGPDFVDYIEQVDRNGNQDNFVIMLCYDFATRYQLVVYKFYRNDHFTFHKYRAASEGNVSEITDDPMFDEGKYSQMQEFLGAFYARVMVRSIDNDDIGEWSKDNLSLMESSNIEDRKQAWLNLLHQDFSSISLEPTVICMSPATVLTKDKSYGEGVDCDDRHKWIGPAAYHTTGSYEVTDDEECRKYPFITMDSGDTSAIFGGKDAYLIVQGTLSYHDEQATPYPLPEASGKFSEDVLSKEGDYKRLTQHYVWARLRWGTHYWNGLGWQEDACDFKIKLLDFNSETVDDDGKRDGYLQNCENYCKELNFLDTTEAGFNTSEKGVYIPVSASINLQGPVEFTIYANRDFYGCSKRNHWHPSSGNQYTRYYGSCMFYKDLNVKAYLANGMLDTDTDLSDTCYTNVIENGAVSGMDEIEFKVCTYDDKSPNYSSVDYLDDDDQSQYARLVFNKALAGRQETDGTEGYDGEAPMLRPEEQYVYKLATQYAEPRAILECNLRNEGHAPYGTYTDETLDGRIFVADTISTDYRMNRQTLRLIEKV